MIAAEVRTYAERAAAARTRLEALLDVLPASSLSARAAGESWDVATHLGHLASADGPLLRILGAALEGPAVLLLAADASAFAAEREAAARAGASLAFAELRLRLRSKREALLPALGRLDVHHLELPVVLPPADAFGAPVETTLRSYLSSWAAHDVGHELAIRSAILSEPSPTAMVLAARRRAGR